ncbi:NAD(P)-binding domain-containing protein [Streptomyces sp. NBC_01549]|uniref:NADPH-dependent F420 reductase n=1 Tax=unclassified Streptomyces TaxID=2593676 RepID=UPI0022579990|nr:NAD(P)-binding domain-containing protein [Streptomyces sp. NBC_01549]MCX4597529.1 NAD(P)-binding domain-containing protein [Streptomyces sp. NBC_01549]
MSSISIIGLGNMARALGARAVAGGHSVQIIGRDAAKAAALADEFGGNATAGTLADPLAGDIVILAVPYGSAAPVVSQYGTALTGKVVIDITNPFNLTTFTDLVTPDDSSAAQEIAKAAAPGAHVVKAFNTLFSGVLATGEVANRPLDVFIAGDDADAKASVAAFIESLGLRPLDAGDLKMAHWLEGAGLLILGQAAAAKDFSLSIKILG